MQSSAPPCAEAKPLVPEPRQYDVFRNVALTAPFGEQTEGACLRSRLDVAICIPVRDEAQRLAACLAAVEEAALQCAGERIGVVLVVNNSVDQSAQIAREWASRTHWPALVCEARPSEGIDNVAHARALAFDLAIEVATPQAVLLATDADTRVTPGWARLLVAAVRQGAAMAAGAIAADPAELASLPPQVRATELLEADLKAAYREIWQLIVPGAPCMPLLTAAGASMAVSAAAYRDVGGLPVGSRNEDRAMVATMLEAGRPVVEAPDAVAVTSCRLDARAADGMAEALLERCHSADPRLDDVLTDLERFIALAQAYGVLSGRLRHVDPDDVAPRLRIPAAMLRSEASAAGLPRRFAAVMDATRHAPRLTRSRGETELRAARRWLNEAAAAAATPDLRPEEHTRWTGGRALCPA